MSTKHDKARTEFWAVVSRKTVSEHPARELQLLKQGVDYMLSQLPTWAVEKATGWLEKWKPD